MDSEARREIDLITPTLFHSRLGKGRRRPGSKGGREKERRGEKKTEGGYDLIRGTPFVHPPSSGNHSNGEGCIFYSRAVCLVRDEYERVRVQRIHRRKGREGRGEGISRHTRARASLISFYRPTSVVGEEFSSQKKIVTGYLFF